MLDRLFVYGTLMRGYDHPMSRLLSDSAEYLGEAQCRGRLYLLKHYPGLVMSDLPSDIVHGELFRLKSLQRHPTCRRPSRPRLESSATNVSDCQPRVP